MSITGKAPVTYDDWCDIYHDALQAMGFAARTYFNVRFKRLPAPQMMREGMARSMWRHTQRLNRIREQLDACHRRKDSTYRDALAEFFGGDSNTEV